MPSYKALMQYPALRMCLTEVLIPNALVLRGPLRFLSILRSLDQSWSCGAQSFLSKQDWHNWKNIFRPREPKLGGWPLPGSCGQSTQWAYCILSQGRGGEWGDRSLYRPAYETASIDDWAPHFGSLRSWAAELLAAPTFLTPVSNCRRSRVILPKI